MMPKPFKLALIQMLVEGGERDANLQRAAEYLNAAANHGANVALLPECFDLGWTHPSSSTMADSIPDGFACQLLCDLAKSTGLTICAGLTEKMNQQIFNSAVLIDGAGQLLCLHRKLNELEIGQQYYAQGDRLNVAQTEFGRFGLMICADGFARDRVLAKALCYMGADVILSPSSWVVPADHDNKRNPYGDVWRDAYIPVAKDFAVAIFSASNVGPVNAGPWQGRKCIGCSLAISPQGEQLLQGPYGANAEAILYLDVQPVHRPTRGTGWDGMPNNCIIQD